MNLDNIESRHIKNTDAPIVRDEENSVDPDQLESDGLAQQHCVPAQPTNVRSNGDWALIVKLVAALSASVGLILGLVCGFAVGRFTSPTIPVEEDTELSIYDQYDYTQFVINEDQNITIDTFYLDSQEKYYAMNLIGTEIPTLNYLNSEGEAITTEFLRDGNYIIEFLEPTCAFCQSMIKDLDEYRSKDSSLPVIGLSIEDGDLSKFNKEAENSFVLIQKDDETENLVDKIAWIPTFVYVSNGTIKLVSFGVLSAEELEENINVAFN